ncbi:MAG: hypothetical protein JRJ45_12985, partial [Deltaproteobacteria bacterium]|nr:hypothetical protein [Deltaproteobacteria bacterium]
MAYRDIASGEKDPESPITPELIEALDNNVDETMAKASGAPVLADDYIVTAMIAD